MLYLNKASARPSGRETRRGRQRLHTKKTRDLVMTMYIVTLAVTATAEETPERGGEVRLGR